MLKNTQSQNLINTLAKTIYELSPVSFRPTQYEFNMEPLQNIHPLFAIFAGLFVSASQNEFQISPIPK